MLVERYGGSSVDSTGPQVSQWLGHLTTQEHRGVMPVHFTWLSPCSAWHLLVLGALPSLTEHRAASPESRNSFVKPKCPYIKQSPTSPQDSTSILDGSPDSSVYRSVPSV